MLPHSFQGLEYLTTPVLLLDAGLATTYVNPAAESWLQTSRKHLQGTPIQEIFPQVTELHTLLRHALIGNETITEHEIPLGRRGSASCSATPVETAEKQLLLEFHRLDQQIKIEREERLLQQSEASRELVRNLAHEIKNPLGGIRGAAQLLELELGRPDLKEYTEVIIQEADRLQSLMERLLTPHRIPQYRPVNVHEVLERVRRLVAAEMPLGIVIERDYDVSLPDLVADEEQLIQATLNIVRNAAQALQGRGRIVLRSRIARSVTIARRYHRKAIRIEIIDNGPGIPQELQDKIFYPLVSGREDGTGLGLTLAQTFINHHQGAIECDSRPGRTRFSLLLPLVRDDYPAPTQ